MPIVAGHSIVENGGHSAEGGAQVLWIFIKGRLIIMNWQNQVQESAIA
jgi:hypothetical protein